MKCRKIASTLRNLHYFDLDLKRANEMSPTCNMALSRVRETLDFRSNPPQVFFGKVVLKLCSKFTEKHSCRNVISIKLLCNFIEITLRRGCFPVHLLHI